MYWDNKIQIGDLSDQFLALFLITELTKNNFNKKLEPFLCGIVAIGFQLCLF